jgi:general secretion pathway protein K
MKLTKRNKQRGVALLSVMIAIAITIVISNQFGTSTSTDMIAAANYRDEMRAHFLARSATNLAELVVRIQQRLDNVQALRGQVQITDYADQLVLPFCGSDAEVKDAIGFSTSQIKGLGADIGTCGFNGPFLTEDSKININCSNVDASWQVTKSAIDALMFFTAYDSVFDDNDAEGWHRDRAMQSAALLDYVDQNTMHARDRGTTEDYGYESLKDRYEPKNTYIDSIGELKMVRGVDDRFWSLFGDSFTVYGDCKVNFPALTDPKLIAAILAMSVKKENQNQPTLIDQRKLYMLAAIVAKAKQFGESFENANDVKEFVADPMQSITMLASSGGLAGSAANNALAQGIGLQPGEKVGLDIDAGLLGSFVTFEPKRTYRIEAYGEVERKQKNADGTPVFPPIRKTVTGVWHMGTTPQNTRKQDPNYPKGAWQFLRED